MAKKKGGKNKSSVTKTVQQNSKSASITDCINTEVIAEALSSANQPVLLKLCRLCETKDGPFLNIFEADKLTAKKIDDLMPFVIEEHDDLPHKICFRCSAKVEELHEFVQKCINTQENLRKAVGKMGPVAAKTKTRALWEEKLNKSNMSNDDICNALIQKAMEGIKDIPIKEGLLENNETHVLKKETVKMNMSTTEKTDVESKKDVAKKKELESTSTKQMKSEKIEEKHTSPRTTRNSTSNVFEPLIEAARNKKFKQVSSDDNDSNDASSFFEKSDRGVKRKAASNKEESPQPEAKKKGEEPSEKEKKKPFDIMDHISMIKVNGVGVLFQCKLCNRNFLKKEVVLSHSCAKNGVPKQELIPDYVPPAPPKPPTVKYINTKTESLHKPISTNNTPIVVDDDPAPEKPRPKAGPASKVKRDNIQPKDIEPSSATQIKVTPTLSTQISAPTVQFPTTPSLNSRYKLLPGPNNTFTLVEEKVTENTEYVSSDDSVSETSKSLKDRKKTESKLKPSEDSGNSKKNKSNGNSIREKFMGTNSKTSDQPYPVGLIRLGHSSNPPVSEPITFTTPAMKKQSYTIVQTGNPSKLLISTKPQPIPEEVPKKKAKKSRHEAREDSNDQPFSVSLEDNAPPKDPAFFTFINVDPLLQPSYVLPTHNIIQESQISTSTALGSSQVGEPKEKDKESKYSCNMCGESFSREKKLLAHIHSHYNKMDEEDQLRERTNKKRVRKS